MRGRDGVGVRVSHHGCMSAHPRPKSARDSDGTMPRAQKLAASACSCFFLSSAEMKMDLYTLEADAFSATAASHSLRGRLLPLGAGGGGIAPIAGSALALAGALPSLASAGCGAAGPPQFPPLLPLLLLLLVLITLAAPIPAVAAALAAAFAFFFPSAAIARCASSSSSIAFRSSSGGLMGRRSLGVSGASVTGRSFRRDRTLRDHVARRLHEDERIASIQWQRGHRTHERRLLVLLTRALYALRLLLVRRVCV